MVKGLYDAARSMHNKIRNIEVVANNIANINTTGYKREIPFSEYLDQQTGVDKLTQLTDFTSGNLMKTGNPFDMALKGNGFFMIETEQGVELTKSGRFTISDGGFLVDQSGNKVLTDNGGINLEELLFEGNNSFQIKKNGEIQIGDNIVGQLAIASIDDQSGMKRMEGQKFLFTDGMHRVALEEEYELHQGYIEESNCNPIIEMQAMIKLNKEYETAAKIINSLDQIMAKSKEIGRV